MGSPYSWTMQFQNTALHPFHSCEVHFPSFRGPSPCHDWFVRSCSSHDVAQNMSTVSLRARRALGKG